MAPAEYAVPNELLLTLNKLCMSKAEQRLAAEECVRVFTRLDAVEVGHFVVVKQPGNFKGAQINANIPFNLLYKI